MKILIISDDKTFTNSLKTFFAENNHSTIIYKWLIKAMDNLEEITPDVIIISADEYPRHWKTLVQFMNSGIAGADYKVFLYKKEDFSSEDEEKIKKLNIEGLFSDYSPESLKKVFEILLPETETTKKEETPVAQELVITNPGTHNFIFGTYFPKSENLLDFETRDSCSNLNVNDCIKKITYQKNEKYISTRAKIIQISHRQDLCNLLLEIQG